uniref:IF rod domain-containing protein n=1 Tax=Caenorhabditis tropicalis TaxID=1561998 RepID=A0A1I7TZC3_9PELO
MENILTRSLYRVLNNTTQVPPHVSSKSQSVDKMGFPDRKTTIAVARPNNHQIGNSSSVNMDLQMRLLAQEICGRVERKYEKKLDEAREWDRRDTERRLSSIRSEYEAKYHLQLGKLEKEKIRLLDQISERERTLEHRMEMRSAEREHDLAAKQRIVENRAIELTLNKENFDRNREEWLKKVEADQEEMRLERERIEIASSKTIDRRRSEIAIEAEVNMWKKRTNELEQDANETRKRIGEMMEENFHLKDQIGSVDQMNRELQVTMSLLNDTRDELAKSKVEIRRTGDYDQIKEENEQLKIEIERIRLKNTQRVQSAIEETVSEYSAKEAKWKRIANLSQQRIAVLTEKIKDLEVERDVLRQEVKNSRKAKGSYKLNDKPQKKIQSNVFLRSISPTESTSSLSEGEMEILNIRQRIQNLDEIAKELDASVAQFATTGTKRRIFDKNESNVELYDDFCRALHSSVIDEEGSPIYMTSSPQKPIRPQHVRAQTPVDSENNNGDTKLQTNHDSWLKRGMRIVSPPAVKKSLQDFEQLSPKTTTSQAPKPDETESTPIKYLEPELSDFEKRMQAREQTKNQTDRRNKILELANVPQPDPVKNSSTEKEEQSTQPTSVNNPMFSGVDPVMAEYMKKMLAARNESSTVNKPIESVQETPAPEQKRSREVEVTLADELELDLDQQNNADDEWW